MSHSFPPPPKRRPWWKFKSTAALVDDRKQYRTAIKAYDRRRAAQGVPPFKHPNFFRRHKILSAIAGFFVFIALIGQIGDGTTATMADPAPVLATTAPPAPASASVPAPTPSNTAAVEAERKRAEKARKAEERAAAKKAEEDNRKVAAEKKKRDEAAAKKKAAEKKKRDEAAAKKQADREKTKREDRERREREQREQDQAKADTRNTVGNCDDMHETYPHGVGQPGATDQTRGSTRPVTNFVRDADIYNLNSGSDRDDDGIACEAL